MATINLYYIKGINAIDTPYFASLAQQQTYFAQHKVGQINDDYWYPPYNADFIQFSTTDVDLDLKANYLSIEYKEKQYYYFIDSLEYVTQDIIGLHVILDSIQTMMFNIEIISTYKKVYKTLVR